MSVLVGAFTSLTVLSALSVAQSQTCTPSGHNPYQSHSHVTCCPGSQEVLVHSIFGNHYLCKNKYDGCTPLGQDPYQAGGHVSCCPGSHEIRARYGHGDHYLCVPGANATNADECDVCMGGGAGSKIEIVNNCGHTVDVSTDAGMYGRCEWVGTKVPACLKQLKPGASAHVTLLRAAAWGYAFHLEKTRFELTPASGKDYYDISYNVAFDIGMTLIPPAGHTMPKLIAKDQLAPAAYQVGASGCQVQPCASPTYSGPQGNYQLYLCNRPGDVNTPGPCGCKACPGIPCARGSPSCTTSGRGIWCLTGGPQCPVCMNDHTCPDSCPDSGAVVNASTFDSDLMVV